MINLNASVIDERAYFTGSKETPRGTVYFEIFEQDNRNFGARYWAAGDTLNSISIDNNELHLCIQYIDAKVGGVL